LWRRRGYGADLAWPQTATPRGPTRRPGASTLGGLIEGSASVPEARTAGFTVLVLAQLFNCISVRSRRASARRGLFANRLLWLAIAVSLLLQIAVVHLPVLGTALGTRPLSLTDWLVCVAMASAVLWFDELRKLVIRLTAPASPAGSARRVP
jgi:Ca2+-transporting ATPase